MKIVIAGAGAVGTHLAMLLSRERNDIILIDEDPASIAFVAAYSTGNPNIYCNGCNFKSIFTPLEDVAIDKKYIPTQCNTYDHEFNIIGKKYSTNENDQITYIIIRLLIKWQKVKAF